MIISAQETNKIGSVMSRLLVVLLFLLKIQNKLRNCETAIVGPYTQLAQTKIHSEYWD